MRISQANLWTLEAAPFYEYEIILHQIYSCTYHVANSVTANYLSCVSRLSEYLRKNALLIYLIYVRRVLGLS